MKIYREWALDVTCIGVFSCQNATIFHLGSEDLTLYLYGPSVGGNMYKYPGSNDDYNFWYLQAQFSMANEVVFFGYQNTRLYISAASDYSLWNVTFKCNYALNSYSRITCTEDNSNQFFIVDESCGYILNTKCNIINSTATIDNNTIQAMDTIIDIIDQFMKEYESECNTNNYSGYSNTDNMNMILDIGYPLYGESFIVNSEYTGAICCRGAESCAYSSNLISNSGNIFCTGDFSCGNSKYVYNGAYSDMQSLNHLNDWNLNSVSIYCMGFSACSGAGLTSVNKIICAAYSSCYYSEITGAKQLYCTDSACDSAIVREVENVYIFGPQTKMTFFSNGVDMNIYFNGKDAGTDISLTCAEGDTCNIVCTINACNAAGTVLTCNGKCFVTCPDDTTDCVDIILSTSPTMAPSAAPTMNPTIPPTNTPSTPPTGFPTINPTTSPTNAPSIYPTTSPIMNPTVSPTFSGALTKEDIGMWFNWVLWSILAGIVIIVIGGFIDSQKFRENELFRWHSIVLFGFYLIDFCSDIFLSMELFVLMMDAHDEHSQFEIVYISLFFASIMFIFVPVITTLVQLHREISKWLVDPILSRTEAQLWILTHARMLYIVAVISGSAFSAVTLLNSNLFRLNAFSMGLARFHRKIFRNKRFFSVVLLEV